jgi:exopolysaccharide biosynthesis polyprenyl glycosylphosphotransferase
MLPRYREFSPERAQKLNRWGDAALLGIAAAAAAMNHGAVDARPALALFASAAVLWVFTSRTLRQYDPENGRGFVGDITLTLVMLAAMALPMALLSLAFGKLATPWHTARFLGVLVPMVLLLRVRLIGLPLWNARPVVDVLIVGIGPFGRLTGEEIGDGKSDRRLLGYLRFDDEAPHDRLHAPTLGTVAELETTLRERVVDEVYFASTATDHVKSVQAAIQTCEELGVPFALPVHTYRLSRAKLTPASAVADGYAHFLNVQPKPFQWAMKRLFDMVATGAALVLLSPLLVVAAIAVKVSSAGPVFFSQKRVGLHGRTFSMLKFRSMVVNAEALRAKLLAANEQSGPVFKMTRDPRVTAVGRFIRKYSIDELPQLVNVLRGDMSIVGPRPPLPNEVERYEGWQRRRLSVRPGLTCVWQVSGRNSISFREWMLLDMRYIDHWTLGGDFELILKTIPVVLTGRGAS